MTTPRMVVETLLLAVGGIPIFAKMGLNAAATAERIA
jgi:hypothetical protein